ncbi:MAG: hypothetical protein RPR98_04450 [Bermanella sp.]
MIVQSVRVSNSREKNMQNKMIIGHLHIAHIAGESLIQSGLTILDIDVGGTRAPKITIQWQGKCARLKPTRHGRINNEAGAGFIMAAVVKKCLVTWIEPAYVKDLADRQRTRPVVAKSCTKPKSVTRIQYWGIE